MIFLPMSLHCKLVPVQHREPEYGLLHDMYHGDLTILIPRASDSFGHLVGETEGELVVNDILRRVALATRMGFGQKAA